MHLLLLAVVVAAASALPAVRPVRFGGRAATTRRSVPRAAGVARALAARGGSDPSEAFTNGVIPMLYAADWIGTVSFAISATLTAAGAGMDLLGCGVVAAVVSMGGGTMRDVLSGRPVFWIESPMYLKITLVTSVLTFFAWPLLKGDAAPADSWLFELTDATGLAAFAVNSVLVTEALGLDSCVCCAAALISACGGGVVRDVLCRQRPRLLHSDRSMYGTPPLLGAIFFLLLTRTGLTGNEIAAAISYLFAFSLRLVAKSRCIKLWTIADVERSWGR